MSGLNTVAYSGPGGTQSPQFSQVVSESSKICGALMETLKTHIAAAENAEKEDDAVAAMVHHIVSLTVDGILFESMCRNAYHSESDDQAEKIQKRNDTVQKQIQKTLALQELVRGMVQSAQCNNQDKLFSCDEVSQTVLSGRNVITFDDIVGFDNIKTELRNAIINPLLYPNLYPAMPRGILFYGLPGTGKTFFVKALVHALNEKFKDQLKILLYTPTGAELKGKYVGETEKRINALFDCAALSAYECACADSDAAAAAGGGNKQKALSIIFIDEIENIAGDRANDTTGLMANSVNVLLQKMDGIESNSNILVLGATNFPWKLDSAVLRRFTRSIHIPLPTHDGIVDLIKKEIKKTFMQGLKSTSDLDCNPIKREQIRAKISNIKGKKDKLCTAISESRVADIPDQDAVKLEELVDAFINLKHKDISQVATELHQKKYSNSDVTRLVAKVMYNAAEKSCTLTAKFYPINGLPTYYINILETDLDKINEPTVKIDVASTKYMDPTKTFDASQLVELKLEGANYKRIEATNHYTKPALHEYLNTYKPVVSQVYINEGGVDGTYDCLLRLNEFQGCTGCFLIRISFTDTDELECESLYYMTTNSFVVDRTTTELQKIDIKTAKEIKETVPAGDTSTENYLVSMLLDLCGVKTLSGAMLQPAGVGVAKYVMQLLQTIFSVKSTVELPISKVDLHKEPWSSVAEPITPVLQSMYAVMHFYDNIVGNREKLGKEGALIEVTLTTTPFTPQQVFRDNVLTDDETKRIKSLNFGKEDFQVAMKSIPSSIREMERRNVEDYAANPSTFKASE
jgi:SpoVK/Ycf46/Vps4 family AAA+-type ATPase